MEFEDVELGVWADVEDGEPELLLWVVVREGRVEDLGVEGVQPVGVAGEDRDVIEAVEQHGWTVVEAFR